MSHWILPFSKNRSSNSLSGQPCPLFDHSPQWKSCFLHLNVISKWFLSIYMNYFILKALKWPPFPVLPHFHGSSTLRPKFMSKFSLQLSGGDVQTWPCPGDGPTLTHPDPWGAGNKPGHLPHTSHCPNIPPGIAVSKMCGWNRVWNLLPSAEEGMGTHLVTTLRSPWAAGATPGADNELLVGLRSSAGPRGEGETPFFAAPRLITGLRILITLIRAGQTCLAWSWQSVGPALSAFLFIFFLFLLSGLVMSETCPFSKVIKRVFWEAPKDPEAFLWGCAE